MGGDKHTDRQTHTRTHGHCDSMTESAQWADSVKKKKHCENPRKGGKSADEGATFKS